MTSKADKQILLVALGGNALIQKGQTGTVEEELQNLKIPISQIARLSNDYRIIITHGNGPQVGNLLLQQECCDDVPRLPLEILVAQTQGQIGYMIESTLDSAFMEMGVDLMEIQRLLPREGEAPAALPLEGATQAPLIEKKKHIVSLISYVVVDEDDPAFQNPTKPIGPVYTAQKAATLPYPTRSTPKGYRRVVASPEPITIVEKHEIKRLVAMDFIVVCCGGGGIPVIREGRTFCGVDAVIDKDLASAVLAREVGVDILLIATDVEGAALDYGTPQERFLRHLTIDEAARFTAGGHFPAGSMGPKVEAATRFIRAGGQRAIICSIDSIEEAVAGRAGTEINR